MTVNHPRTNPLNLRTVFGAPVLAFFAVLLTSCLTTAATGTMGSISEATGQSIPFALGALLVTLAAFGGLPAGEVNLAVGTVGFTFVAIPFIFTALAAFILFKTHKASELRMPQRDLADRLLSGACSGMTLLLCCVLAWFVANILNPETSRANLTSNVFLLAAGALLVGTVFSTMGRYSAHHHRPAWLFTLKYGLATGIPIALVVCVFLTISYDWGSSSWLLIGNMASGVWAALHAGLLTWSLDLSPLGGPESSGTGLLAAVQTGPWTAIALPLGAIAIIVATLAWRKDCLKSTKWDLPCAFMVVSAVTLAAGTWFSGYVKVAADTSRLSAMLLLSPFNIAIMGCVGLLIDRLARLMVTAGQQPPNHTGSPSTGEYPHHPAGR